MAWYLLKILNAAVSRQSVVMNKSRITAVNYDANVMIFWHPAKRPGLAGRDSLRAVPPVRVGSVDFVQSVIEVEDCFLQDLTRN